MLRLELRKWTKLAIISEIKRLVITGAVSLPCGSALLFELPEKTLKELCLTWDGRDAGGVDCYRIDPKKLSLLTDKNMRNLLDRHGIKKPKKYAV